MTNDNTAEQLKCREAFEREITAPPYELSVSSYPDNDTSAWPGNYRDYKVELAWCMFQSAWNTRQVDPNFPDEIDELKLTLVEVTEERDHLRSVMESTRADSGDAVAWQFRLVGNVSGEWQECRPFVFSEMEKAPELYETRKLFTHPSAAALDVRAIETLVTRWLGMRMACTSDEVGSSQAVVFHYCAHDLRAFLSQRVEKGNDKSRD